MDDLAETEYDRDELIMAAAAFGVRPEVMAGALRLAGQVKMTRVQVDMAVKIFLSRKV